MYAVCIQAESCLSGKLQLTVETVLDLFFVPLKFFQFLLGLRVEVRVCAPLFVDFLITHLFTSSLIFIIFYNT